MFGLKLKELSNFHPFEVVGSGRETQLVEKHNFKSVKIQIN